MGRFRKTIRTAVGGLPVLGRLFYRHWVYRGGLSDEALRAALGQVGHYVDLRLTTGDRIPRCKAVELGFLLGEAGRRGWAADPAVRWAAERYAMLRFGLRPAEEERAETAPDTGGGGDLEEAIRQRRSVRVWTDDPVNLAEIRDIIDAARWAPSSCNRQTVRAMVLERGEVRDFVSAYFPNRFHEKAPVLVLVLVDQTPYGGNDRHFVYLDAGAFIQNMLLLLHARGYGACWLGFKGWDNTGRVSVDQRAYEAFRERLGLLAEYVPVSAVAVGRPAKVPPPPARRPLDQVIIEPA